MRMWNRFSLSMILAGALSGAAGAQAQVADRTQPQAGNSTAATVLDNLPRVMRRLCVLTIHPRAQAASRHAYRP